MSYSRCGSSSTWGPSTPSLSSSSLRRCHSIDAELVAFRVLKDDEVAITVDNRTHLRRTQSDEAARLFVDRLSIARSLRRDAHVQMDAVLGDLRLRHRLKEHARARTFGIADQTPVVEIAFRDAVGAQMLTECFDVRLRVPERGRPEARQVDGVAAIEVI